MTRKVMTPAAAMEAKRLYALRDEWGRQVYSQMDIARIIGVSETTVFRAIHRAGAYMGLRDLPTDQEAKESLERFKARFPDLVGGESALGKMERELAVPKVVEGMLGELARKPPPSPLDEGEEEEMSSLERSARLLGASEEAVKKTLELGKGGGV